MTHARHTPIRLVLAAVATMALAFGLAGCGGDATGNADAVSDSGKVDLSKVVLKVGDQRGTSAKDMLEAAGLANTPYKIEWHEFSSGPPLLEALSSGSVHIGEVGNTPPIFAAASGTKFKMVAATDYTGTSDAIVAPKGSTITNVRQLKGKTVAVAPGSSANYNLLGQLAKVGMSLSDVHVAELQPADAMAALAHGKVDAWATWAPYTSQVELQDGAKPIVDGSNGVMNGLAFQAASDDALDDPATKAAIEDYLTRIQKAQVWSGQPKNRTAWSKAWSKGSGLPVDVLERATKTRPVTAVPIDESVIDSEQKMADAFTTTKTIPKKVDLADYFTDEFNHIATGSAVKPPAA